MLLEINNMIEHGYYALVKSREVHVISNHIEFMIRFKAIKFVELTNKEDISRIKKEICLTNKKLLLLTTDFVNLSKVPLALWRIRPLFYVFYDVVKEIPPLSNYYLITKSDLSIKENLDDQFYCNPKIRYENNMLFCLDNYDMHTLYFGFSQEMVFEICD